jgi:hypothetical protein
MTIRSVIIKLTGAGSGPAPAFPRPCRSAEREQVVSGVVKKRNGGDCRLLDRGSLILDRNIEQLAEHAVAVQEMDLLPILSQHCIRASKPRQTAGADSLSYWSALGSGRRRAPARDVR